MTYLSFDGSGAINKEAFVFFADVIGIQDIYFVIYKVFIFSAIQYTFGFISSQTYPIVCVLWK